MSSSFLDDRPAGRAAAVRTVYENADVDAYRRAYGKAEGERRFFAEHAPAHRDADQDAPEVPPFDWEEIGPFDSVYLDTSDFYFGTDSP